jgi:hypothetical protein
MMAPMMLVVMAPMMLVVMLVVMAPMIRCHCRGRAMTRHYPCSYA